MVQIQIIPKTKRQSEDIITFLLEEKHVLTVMTTANCTISKLRIGDVIKSSSKVLITAVTRSLHFSNLNTALKERYQDKMPILYSTPIIHMDADQAEEIVNYIEAF